MYCGRVPSEAAIVPIKAFQVLSNTSQVLFLYTGCKCSSPSTNKNISGTLQFGSCIVVVHRLQVKQGRRWVLTRLLQWPGVALCLHHPPTQPTQARPSKGTQILFAKQPTTNHQDRPQPLNPSILDFGLTLTTISAKLTQAFLCRTAERVLECKWKVMIRVVHLSWGNLLPTAQAGQGQTTVHGQLFRRH